MQLEDATAVHGRLERFLAEHGMAELRAEVMERASQLALQCMHEGDPDAGSPYLAMGFGTLRFAREEPHLFRLIAGSPEGARELIEQRPPPAPVLDGMRQVPELAVKQARPHPGR